MYIPRPAKLLFTVDDSWNLFLNKFGDSVTPWTRLCVECILACGTAAMGVRRYCCASANCTHSSFFCQSCKSKACSSCGHKATKQCITEQQQVLPDSDWQHITFTMPHLLWPFFNNNWPLLNALFRAATRGGLDVKHGVWRDHFFKMHTVEEIWRGTVIRLLHHSYDLINPVSLPGLGISSITGSDSAICRRSTGAVGRYISRRKPRGAWRSVKYLGWYLKRSQVSVTKLRHYSGGAVVHPFYNHRTQQYQRQTLSQEEMIGRYISHIPAKHFKMVRYYGFLSNRKRGELLLKEYEALEMNVRKKPEQPGFAALMKGFLRTDPYKCILCGNRLRFSSAQAGRHATELVAERLHSIDRKQRLPAQAAGYVRPERLVLNEKPAKIVNKAHLASADDRRMHTRAIYPWSGRERHAIEIPNHQETGFSCPSIRHCTYKGMGNQADSKYDRSEENRQVIQT